MTKKLIRYFCASVLMGITGIVLAISPSEKQQVDNFKFSTLKDLRGVAIKVVIMRDDENMLPFLKEQTLQGIAEAVLQNAGIELAKPTADIGIYAVVVKVTAASEDHLNIALNVQSSLLQIVTLSRDTTIKSEVQTWPSFAQSRFGAVSVATAKSTIERAVKDQANDFVNDWKTANPKQ